VLNESMGDNFKYLSLARIEFSTNLAKAPIEVLVAVYEGHLRTVGYLIFKGRGQKHYELLTLSKPTASQTLYLPTDHFQNWGEDK
jgi:hypothetical protein